ncbi:hypothetical protein [Methylobacterium radiotolerans]|uniref:hypothetical protein n=1 Tax=Methylobacterium radiotolerans TaxID=31998 RepID=UPI000D5E3340|nr:MULTISPECIES: hypothetical protein [Methylobacterium]MDE3749569.1 hypothetical protein [Methylobacterium radiotolerans]PVZ05950.1 hypothetical protein C7388_10338 [Methylobacterium organophilum]
MDEAVLALLGTLSEIERELGRPVYDSAVERARLAIAAEVMVEAERRALSVRRQSDPIRVRLKLQPGLRDGNVVHLQHLNGVPSDTSGGPDATA